jgi:hypothetical protein
MIDAMAASLDYPVRDLPCTYLGLPLSVKKLRKPDLQPILDKLTGKPSYWKARLLTKDSRVAYI